MLADARAVRAYQEQRYRDAGLLPERDRLIRRLYSQHASRSPFYCQALIQLGRWMVIQGWSLQQRYGSATPPTFVQPANNPVN